ncbi:MAG: cadmium-translocating P-type ATPase, partial [Clostridia bacterium]|nr:cadmium-translocating P-type ATPase [Clostridia bacterium]
AGGDVLREAAEGLLHGEWLDENFLMSVATLGALTVGFLPGGEPSFAEAVLVMLLFQVGEWLEELAEERSRRSISHLTQLRPDTVHVLRDGQAVPAKPEDVVPGDILLIRPGDRIPVDGTVVQGSSSLDTAALTGESLPRPVQPGDTVPAGCLNREGVLHLQADQPYGASAVARILQLVEEAGENKSNGERMITRFARVYTPAVVAAALLLAVVPPLCGGAFLTDFALWLRRALTLLIVSCPCALVISVPLSFFCGIGNASRHGLLIKGSRFLDALARVDTLVLDKTGTLTCGSFAVQAVHSDRYEARQLLHLAAHAERHSTHPIALSLRQAYADEADGCEITDTAEVPGKGVRSRINGQEICVGNPDMMDAVGAACRPCHRSGSIVHVAVNGDYAGHIVVSDRIRQQAAPALAALRRDGVRQIVMLTGDSERNAAAAAAELPLDRFAAELLPQDKAEHVQALKKQLPAGRTLAFVGDGINDAPVLAAADIGIAMGGLGSEAAVETADAVLMRDDLSALVEGRRIARRTRRIARQNVVLSLAIKAAVLVLAVLGLAPMWLAVLADVGVTLLAVSNALRAAR